MAIGDLDPTQLSYVYFGGTPDRAIVAPHVVLGNVVVVPADQLSEFMVTANPADLDAFVSRHPQAAAHELGRLAASHAITGKPIEVTDQANTVITETQELIRGLPPNFRLDFPEGGQQQSSLRIQKTANGELLLGVVPPDVLANNSEDVTYMLYALFGPDGTLRGYSDYFAYPFDGAGQRVPEGSPQYIKDGNQTARFSYWMDYLPTAKELIDAHEAGDMSAVQQQLDALRNNICGRGYSMDTPRGNLSVPDFMRALDPNAKENLIAYGELPEGFIPPTLPSDSVLESLRLFDVAEISAALERWGIPYSEVSYSAGVREVHEADFTWAMVEGQLDNYFNHSYNVLPATFRPRDTREHNDIYARILVVGVTSETEEQKVLLYDGCQYVARAGSLVERPARLQIPSSVRDFLAQPRENKQDDVLRQTLFRPSAQVIRSNANISENLHNDRFTIELPALGVLEERVVIGGQRLPLTPAMLRQLQEVRTIGEGPLSRQRQELTVVYHRIGDELLPVVDGAVTVVEKRYPDRYKV